LKWLTALRLPTSPAVTLLLIAPGPLFEAERMVRYRQRTATAPSGIHANNGN
jgi:hypothetical protein